jgi:hypothetical protein
MSGGIAAAVVGGVALYYGTLGGPDERYVYDSAMKIGFPVALVGSAAVTTGGVLLARERHDRSALGASLVGGGIALAALGGMFLHYGSLGGPDERYAYDNATTIGLSVTVVGSAAILAGGVLWVRGRHRTAPVVTASSGLVQLGFAGSF